MRLLFTGGGGAASSALARLYPDAHFADADPDARPFGVALDRWHTVPLATAATYVQALADLCRSIGTELIVPGVDEELLKVSMARTWHELPCNVLLPSSEFIAIHQDKLASMRGLDRAGISVPKTQRLAIRRHEEDLRRERGAGILEPDQWGWQWLSFPCVVKPREGRGSRNVRIAKSAAEVHAHILLSGLSPSAFIIQELMVGPEYTVTMVADKRCRIRAVVPVPVGLKRGVTVRGRTEAQPDVMAVCQRIHEVDPTSGVYNIQGILTESGFQPFEINPRVSTTTCLAIAAGVDPFALYLDEGPVTGLAPFCAHLTLKRSWHTEFAA